MGAPLGALKAFSLLRKFDKPESFVLLSGSDYPVRPAAEIVAELSNTTYDAYLDNREILWNALPPGQTARDGGHGRPSWIPLAYHRYCTCLWWPCPSRTLLCSRVFPIRKRYVSLGKLDRMIQQLHLNRPSRIYGGDFWFQANRKAIDHLLDDPSIPGLIRVLSLTRESRRIVL